MSAGLVRYRLCDREFDCERCPLDAALRGETAWVAADPLPAAEGGPALRFPDDRRYSEGHCWVQAAAGSAWRVGLDALAAALVGTPLGLRPAQDAAAVACRDPVLAVQLPQGVLSVGAPMGGLVLRLNDDAQRAPGLAAEDPYGEGWLFEMRADGDPTAPLLDAAAALQRSRLDLRHFGRRAALALLSQTDELGATMADGGQPLTDLRRILGSRSYLSLLRDLVH